MRKLKLTLTMIACVMILGSLGFAAYAAANDDTVSTDNKNSNSNKSSNQEASDSKSKPADTTKKVDNEKGKKGNKSSGVNVISVAAKVLDKTTDEVREAVKTGKVGDLLVAAGKVDAFKTEYLAQIKATLDEKVTAGALTQTEADEKYAAAKTKMEAYNGTTHLCGGTDHSKMFEKKNSSDSEKEAA